MSIFPVHKRDGGALDSVFTVAVERLVVCLFFGR